MKTTLFTTLLLALGTFAVQAQFTQINSNKSLVTGIPLSNTKAIFTSDIDSTIWVTDGTAAGTIQLSPDLRVNARGGVLNGKFIFTAISSVYGAELFSTDGTVAGTTIVKDINAGTSGSEPGDDMTLLNGFVYFTASTPATGRELWKTDGTDAGTTMVKDIVAGPTDSNDPYDYHLHAANAYILFAVKTAANGNELWKSDGTDAGTVLLKDINTGTESSDPSGFQLYNNIVLFTATDATHGNELWKTDGTPAGTILLKDINTVDPTSSVDPFFFIFNGKAYFSADNGTVGSELWSTDGTEPGTVLVKDIEPGILGSFTLLINAVKVGNKFIFGAFTMNEGFELWESDGTPAGTKILKDIIPGSEGSNALIFSPGFNFLTGADQPLFQNNKFFFMAETEAEGTELWVSDGTAAGTKLIKDINPGTENGVSNPTFAYTTTALYFPADDNVKGVELWKTDGTDAGTTIAADVNVGAGSSEPNIALILNGKLIFSATNGDVADVTDLYVLDGNLVPLPVKLVEFTVAQKNNDAVVLWSTAQEVNMKDYSIQRSFDGLKFETLGSIAATGSLNTKQNYSFVDAGVMKSGKDVAYYRLVSGSKDGKSEVSKIISLKLRGTTNFSAQLVMNPVQSDIKLMLSGTVEKTRLSIKDLHGRTVYTSEAKGNGLISLPAADLATGMYVLVAESNQKRITVSFLKQ